MMRSRGFFLPHSNNEAKVPPASPGLRAKSMARDVLATSRSWRCTLDGVQPPWKRFEGVEGSRGHADRQCLDWI
jgi:hypothetical protein